MWCCLPEAGDWRHSPKTERHTHTHTPTHTHTQRHTDTHTQRRDTKRVRKVRKKNGWVREKEKRKTDRVRMKEKSVKRCYWC